MGARALDLELKNNSRASIRKTLHVARVAENVAAPVAETSRGGHGQNGRTAPVVTDAGRQPVGTDMRIDESVSVQSDFRTQMQIMTGRMGRIFNPFIPALLSPGESTTTPPGPIRQLFGL